MMKASFIAYLASANILVSALPSNLKDVSEREAIPDNVAAAVGDSWVIPNYCTAATQPGAFQDIYTALVDAPVSRAFDYTSFCSAVVRSITVATIDETLAGVKTEAITSTRTTRYTTTQTHPGGPGPSGVLCATPSSNMQCGITANGYSTNLISNEDASGADCDQACLRNSACKSFQIVPQDNGDSTYDLCNLYKVGVAGNVDTSNPQFIKGKIYDRNCPNFLPAGCNHRTTETWQSTYSRTTITTQPTYSRTTSRRPPLVTAAPDAIQVAAIQKREYIVPDFLSSKQLILLQPVCSCLVTQAPPDQVLTMTNQVQSWDYVTVETVRTIVVVATEYPDWTPTYSTVA